MEEAIASPAAAIPPDSEHHGLMRLLPPRARDFASTARFDRPIGWWLLFWPGAWAVLLGGGAVVHWRLLGWLLLGSVAMRGAGCVWNDIADADLDRQVARTAARPIASGRVSRRAALAWLAALCLVGLIVLLQLHRPAQLVALASLLLVAAYPYMKRLTGWPQAWLGLVFTWAAPVGWVEAHGWRDLATLAALYAGCWAWVMGYDTIYACQDREDDAVVGIGSSARSLGRHIRPGVALLYTLALAGWATAIWQVRPDPLALLALAPVAAHLGWQTLTLHPDDASNVLTRFRSNRFAGLLMALGCGVVGTAG